MLLLTSWAQYIQLLSPSWCQLLRTIPGTLHRGSLFLWYSIGQAVSSIPNGTIIDRIGLEMVFCLASLFIVSCSFNIIGAEYFYGLCGTFYDGLGYSAINPATSKGVFLCFANRRATAMGIKQTGVPLGGIIAGLVGGLAVAHNVEASGWNLQWQTIMLLIAAITFVGIGLCLILPKSLNEAKETAIKLVLRMSSRYLRPTGSLIATL